MTSTLAPSLSKRVQARAPRVKLPKAFRPLFNPWRYKVYYGGRGSAKSWSIAIALVLLAVNKPVRILCAREIQKSIKDSVLQLLVDTIDDLGLSDFFQVYKTEIRGANGSRFFFEGLRHNVKSVKSKEGIDICWVEEADTVSESSWQLLIPTIRKSGSEIWISFNPDSPDDPTYTRFVLNPPPNAFVQKVTWKENPWFPEELRQEMEWDYKVDPERAEHIWGGVPRVLSQSQIFRGKYSIQPFEIPEGISYIYGADWGFAQDPTALVRMFIHDGRLYIDAEAYGVGVDLDDTPQLFDSILIHQRWPVRADSARPETISFMNRRGYNILKAKKGKGSVEDGIEFIRSFEKVIIHPRCKRTADEFRLYSYKVDRMTGDVLPIVEDKHNHTIDAIRYALEPLMKGGRIGKPRVSADSLGL